MPNIVIENPKSLGISISSKLLGYNTQYRRIKTVSISGYLFDLANQIGVSGILSQLENKITNYLSQNADLIIKGQNFGIGELESVSFSSGNDVRIKEYYCSFVFYENVNLANFVSGVDTSNFRFLNSLSENLSSEWSVGGDISFIHSISISFGAGNSADFDAISLAKTLALQLYSSPFSNLNSLWKSANSDCGVLYEEVYNEITHECSFKKSFSGTDSGFSPIKETTNIYFKFDAGGIVTVTEEKTYKTTRECFNLAIDKMNSDLSTAYSRCNSFYSSNYSGPALLFEEFVAKSSKISAPTGDCSYSITFSNDSSYTPWVLWTYSNSVSISENGYYDVNESGSLKARGVLIGNERQNRVNNYWHSVVEPGIQNRCNSYVSSVGMPPSACPAPNLRKKSESVTKHSRKGELSYNYSFTNDPSVKTEEEEANSGIVKEEIILTNNSINSNELLLSSNYLIPNYKEIKFITDKNKGLSVSIEKKVVYARGHTPSPPENVSIAGDRIDYIGYSIDYTNNTASSMMGVTRV